MYRSGIFLAIVFIGCLSAVSMVIGELETVTAGIEFGTSTSCVGVYMNGHVEIIPNDQGNRTTPPWVAFTDSERPLIGEAAKNQAAANPERTIFDVKRLIGRKFEDKEVQSHMRDVPYKVVNRDGKPYIQVEATVFSPEEISAIFLTKQKETAEAFLGKKITKAVVPVPPYFDDAQRQATRDACFMAGYKTVKIINEPTSVGFAYGLHKVAAEKNAVVFDLGDATFDFSVLAIESGVIEILATTHNRLGGEDFNKRRIVGLLKKSMEDAGLENHQIDDIILVGASKNANFPKVQQLLKDYFDGKEPRTSVSPDEAIAFGAAVLGDVLTEQWRNLMC